MCIESGCQQRCRGGHSMSVLIEISPVWLFNTRFLHCQSRLNITYNWALFTSHRFRYYWYCEAKLELTFVSFISSLFEPISHRDPKGLHLYSMLWVHLPDRHRHRNVKVYFEYWIDIVRDLMVSIISKLIFPTKDILDKRKITYVQGSNISRRNVNWLDVFSFWPHTQLWHSSMIRYRKERLERNFWYRLPRHWRKEIWVT